MKGPKGDRYVLVVIKVTGRTPDGRPATGEFGYDETVFDLKQGDEFITAFIPEKIARKTAN